MPRYGWTGESTFKECFDESKKMSPNQLEKRCSDIRSSLAIPLGSETGCVVLQIKNGLENYFNEVPTDGSLFSKDTYAVKSIDFIDYYYRIGHLPFVIPTCRHIFGGPILSLTGSISLLAEHSFVFAAGSPDYNDGCFGEDENKDLEYEVLNDKEIMMLPQCLLGFIMYKFNFRPLLTKAWVKKINATYC